MLAKPMIITLGLTAAMGYYLAYEIDNRYANYLLSLQRGFHYDDDPSTSSSAVQVGFNGFGSGGFGGLGFGSSGGSFGGRR